MIIVPRGPFGRNPMMSSLGAQGFPSPIGSANLELYLDSLLGTSGYANGASVTNLPDQSGHGRDAVTNPGVPVPTMTRAGAGRSANLSPTVTFNGLDAPNGQQLFSALPNPWPTVVRGYTYLFYGRLRIPGNGFSSGVLFQNSNNTGPEAIYRSAGAHAWGWRDRLNFRLGNAFTATEYGAVEWVFELPGDGSTNGNVQDYTSGAQVTQVTATWDQTDVGVQSGYLLSGNNVQNICADMDLCAFVWWSRRVPDAELSLYRSYFKARFG